MINIYIWAETCSHWFEPLYVRNCDQYQHLGTDLSCKTHWFEPLAVRNNDQHQQLGTDLSCKIHWYKPLIVIHANVSTWLYKSTPVREVWNLVHCQSNQIIMPKFWEEISGWILNKYFRTHHSKVEMKVYWLSQELNYQIKKFIIDSWKCAEKKICFNESILHQYCYYFPQVLK